MVQMAFQRTNVKTKKTVQVADNITITQEQHELLIQAIKKRLDFGNGIRRELIDRLTEIDKQLAGYLILDQDDKQRQIDNSQGKGPKPVDMNLQLTDAQLDEGVTYLL